MKRGDLLRHLMRIRVEHVALWVRDLEPMREFYVANLGGDSGTRYHNPRTGFTSYFISFGEGCRIELMQGPAVRHGSVERTAGYAHMALSLGGRQAVDAAVEAMRQRGVTIVSPPPTTGDGYYEAVILDPEGSSNWPSDGAATEAPPVVAVVLVWPSRTGPSGRRGGR